MGIKWRRRVKIVKAMAVDIRKGILLALSESCTAAKVCRGRSVFGIAPT